MRIRTQFIMTMLLFSVLLAGVSASAIMTNHQVEKAREQEEIAGSIAQGASELSYLANDYVIFHESQQLERWQTRFASFSTDVSRLEVTVPEQQALVRNIQANTRRLKDVFDGVVSAIGSSSQESGAIDIALLQVSWSRMAVQSQGVASDASRLAELLNNQVNQSQQTNTVIVIVLISVFVAYFLVNYLMTQRRALGEIANLQAGTAIIGSGNLDFKIEERRNDEIGDLSRAFNKMTTDLKSVTASKADLEREIVKRSEVEEELRVSNEHLQDQTQKLEEEIEERKRVQAELESISTQRQLALDAARMGWWHYDPITRISRWDERYKEIFEVTGYEKPNDEILATRIHPEDLPGVLAKVEAALDPVNLQPYSAEYRINLPDGSIRWIEAHGVAAFEGTGQDKHATSLIGTVADITDRKKAEEELARLNRALRAISDCNQAIVRANDEQGLLTDVCRTMCEVVGYRLGWIGTIEHDEAKSVRPVAWYGDNNGYLTTANITWADTERGRGPTGIAARTGKTDFCQDFVTEPKATPWRDGALARRFRSSIAIPLFDNEGSVFAVFTLYASEPNSFTPPEVRLLEELAGDLSFGVNALRTQEERRKAEEALKESEQRWATTLASIGDAVIATDVTGRITFMNAVAEGLTGWTFQEASGRPVTDIFNIINEETRKVVESPAERVIQQGLVVGLANHTILVRKDGTEVPIDDSGAPIKYEDGRIRGVVLVFRDITGRRWAEEESRTSSRRLEAALSAIEGGIYDHAVPLDETTYHSDGWAKLLGYDHSELPAYNEFLNWLYAQVHEEDLERLKHAYNDFVEGRSEKYDVEVRLRHKQGHWVWVRGISRPVERYTDGGPKRITGIMFDITDFKEVEQIKDEFIGMVSHELRTPLTIVTGAIHTAMLEGLPPEELPLLLQEAASGADSLAGILDNLLELSRYQANRLNLSVAPTNIKQVMDDVVGQLKGKSPIHQLTVDVPDQLPSMQADKMRVERIVYNLTENAIKYSPKGGEVRITARRDGDSLTVSVSDRGMGISPEDQSRLFQPFQRLEKSMQQGIKGLGLGLVVCQRLVEAHHGRIWVESEVGKGSTFYFSIPMNAQNIDDSSSGSL